MIVLFIISSRKEKDTHLHCPLHSYLLWWILTLFSCEPAYSLSPAVPWRPSFSVSCMVEDGPCFQWSSFLQHGFAGEDPWLISLLVSWLCHLKSFVPFVVSAGSSAVNWTSGGFPMEKRFSSCCVSGYLLFCFSVLWLCHICVWNAKCLSFLELTEVWENF